MWWRKNPRTDAYGIARQEMVAGQLKRRGIQDPRVLAAMGQVPRELFVPASVRERSYDDGPLAIGCGQTISQPYVVAFMAEALQLTGTERVLEVGTGSGYGAAVLSFLAAEVHTIERIAELAAMGTSALRDAGCHNVTVHVGDGSLGAQAYAPFDAICVTAAAPDLPSGCGDQLAEQGRIVIPIGGDEGQTMYRFVKHDGELVRESLGQFSFVPLIGKAAWPG